MSGQTLRDDETIGVTGPDRRLVAFNDLMPSAEYLRSLDGLRACAVLLVLIAHAGLGHIVPGGFGVTLFFFISGLLITRLLLAELNATGGISFARFYARRFLRLYPAMLTMIVASAMIMAKVGDKLSQGEWLSALFYYVNYYGIYQQFWHPSSIAPGRSHPVGILWSLSVEEHYYLAYPLVVSVFATRRQQLLSALTAAAVVILVWRYYLSSVGSDAGRIYAATDTRLDSILYGAMLAVALSLESGQRIAAVCTRRVVLVTASTLLVATFVYRDPVFRETLRYALQGIALFPLVCALCFSDRLLRLRAILESRVIVGIGLSSYSIYLFHSVAIKVADAALGTAEVTLAWLAIMVPMTVVLSAVSYFGIERPTRELRRRFGSRR